jgi:hypothetical protein
MFPSVTLAPQRRRVAAWLDSSQLAGRLEATLPVTLGLSLALLALPRLLGFANSSYLYCTLILVLAFIPFALREAPASRRVFVSIAALAFMLRLILLTAVFNASVKAGGPFLGPDSTQFFRESHVLADRGFALGAHPIAVFETYDVAHYYIYGFLIGGFDADLFALQLFNSGLTALAAALMFSVGRIVVPQWATAYGLLIAINPSLMVLSIKDLLKDPSILAAVTVAVWALVHVCQEGRWTSRVAYGLIGSMALAYLHMDRFYVAAYLEIAAAALLAFLLWRAPSRIRPHILVPLFLVFAVAEAVPMTLGWKSTPGILLEQVRFVSRTQAMLINDDGLAQKALRSRAEMRAAALRAKGRDHITTLSDDDLAMASPSFSVVGFSISAVKRLFGPFVWIVPREWTVRELLRGDYLLYPGTIVWYLVLPLATIGCITTAIRIVQGRESNALVIALTVFCVMYFTQYILINLSFRQRDVMFPFWALFAVMGAPVVLDHARWRRAFLLYWAALGVFAVAHLVFRALMA